MIEARDLGFEWSPGATVLERWSATFGAGTMTALTGPSGRGKSTLLYLLGLMLRPTHGHVLIDDEAASDLRDAARARVRSASFGFVFQDAALDSTRTVIDNVTEVALYRREDRAAAARRGRELLERFGVDVSPLRKPAQVSGGQAQRIALCRALLSRPRILLADEPTGNLDPATSDTVIGALAEHAQSGATVIVVTHSPAVAAACDREISL